MSGLSLLARHARERAAAGGSALLRVQLFPIGAESRLQLGHQRGFANMGGTVGSQTLAEPVPASEHVAPLDSLAHDGPELVTAACLLLTDFAQACGYPRGPSTHPRRPRHATRHVTPSTNCGRADGRLSGHDIGGTSGRLEAPE
jgi:hypothetical protein